MQYDSFSLACGIIMAARKMVRTQDKWPEELVLMTGGRKTQKQVKRAMIHIFEFYEEAFPEHSLKNQGISAVNSEKSEAARKEVDC